MAELVMQGLTSYTFPQKNSPKPVQASKLSEISFFVSCVLQLIVHYLTFCDTSIMSDWHRTGWKLHVQHLAQVLETPVMCYNSPVSE